MRSSNVVQEQVQEFRTACEHTKHTLSSATQTTIEIASSPMPVSRSCAVTCFITTLKPIEEVLWDSKIDKDNAHEIVLAGSSILLCY
ncbi:hypothetical protein AZE42_11518 [Rhizopogon vesiculosus]|uniref:Uncharacterized protein n=1 Tax=Rhizopogon vesiculosus TaxID=180088 RepID=A0A1J8QY72_9AGAM|nr:hypothetical protein AZE42_11518 [Rhizopogon vesiculosus]